MHDEQKKPSEDHVTEEELKDVAGGATSVQGRTLQGKTLQGSLLQGDSLQSPTLQAQDSSLETLRCKHGKPIALCDICAGTGSGDP